jgi:cytochrome c biogenesis protein CcdA
MGYWLPIALIVIGVAVVLLPFVVIAVSTSNLLPQERSAFLVLYAAAILLVGIAAADTAEWLPSRPLVDVALLVGGFALGAYASRIISGFRQRGRARP